MSVSAISAKSVKVTFSGNASDLQVTDLSVNGGLQVIDIEVGSNKSTAVVTFNRAMVDGAEYKLEVLNEDGDVVSSKGFKYELTNAKGISLTKTTFEKGENVLDYVAVYDQNGIEISKAEYNLVGFESSNTNVVPSAAGVTQGVVQLDQGTSNVRVELEFKDGSKDKSDFIRVDVEKPVAAAQLEGFQLDFTTDFDGSLAAVKKNTVDYRMASTPVKTYLYKTEANDQYLFVYGEDSKGNPEIEPMDLGSTAKEYTTTAKNSAIVSVTQDPDGVLLTPISVGKTTIEIKGANNYKKNITVEVKKDPEYKDFTVSATNVKLSDEAVAGTEEGVNQETILVEWLDQYGNKYDFGNGTTSAVTVGSDGQEQVIENVIEAGDKLVISTTSQAYDLAANVASFILDDFTITAVAGKTEKNSTVRVSYYKDATATRATTQKTISTTVVDVNIDAVAGLDAAVGYEVLIDNAAIVAGAADSKDTATIQVFALDANNNRFGEVSATLDFSSSVTDDDKTWIADPTGNDNVTFVATAEKYLVESGAVKLAYTVEGSSDPHGTVTINYSNGNKVPAKALVNTKPVVIDITKEPFATQANVSIEQLLFGAIDETQLVIDNTTIAPANTGTKPAIAIKKGFNGYINNPILSILDQDGKPLATGAGLYGLDVNAVKTGNVYIVTAADGTSDTVFTFVVSVTNLKDVTGTGSTNLALVGTAETGSATLVIKEVTRNGDLLGSSPVNESLNLLAKPVTVNVILNK